MIPRHSGPRPWRRGPHGGALAGGRRSGLATRRRRDLGDPLRRRIGGAREDRPRGDRLGTHGARRRALFRPAVRPPMGDRRQPRASLGHA